MSYVNLERTELRASLSSWITSAMNALNAAAHEWLIGYIHWPRHRCPKAYDDDEAFARCPNMFEWYFDQPCCRAHPSTAPIWPFEDSHPRITKHPMVDDGAFYRRHLLFNRNVTDRFESLVASHGLRLGETIAVSWRGTDNVADGRPRVPIEQYFPVIDRILEVEPDLAVFVKAEEQGATDTLLRRYPNAITVPEFFSARAGESQMQDWVSPAPGYERGMQVALLILLFSRCKFLLKINANLSDIAARLSSGTVINVRTLKSQRCLRRSPSKTA